MTESAEIKKCPACGFTQKDFTRTLHFGCPACYGVFRAELSTFLPKMHRGLHHRGKTPKSFNQARELLAQELREVEQLLTHSANAGETDDLLDRWRQLAVSMQALSAPEEHAHEDS